MLVLKPAYRRKRAATIPSLRSDLPGQISGFRHSASSDDPVADCGPVYGAAFWIVDKSHHNELATVTDDWMLHGAPAVRPVD